MRGDGVGIGDIVEVSSSMWARSGIAHGVDCRGSCRYKKLGDISGCEGGMLDKEVEHGGNGVDIGDSARVGFRFDVLDDEGTGRKYRV